MKEYSTMRGLNAGKGILENLHQNMLPSLDAFENSARLNLPEKVKKFVNKFYVHKKFSMKKLII